MQKNSITNKITPCCGLPFSVIYWWVSNLTLNSEADREFIISKISQGGIISIDAWKVLINSGTLEADASLTKAEFLDWFDCERQLSCEQLKIIIEGYKMGSWVGDLNEIRFVNVLGDLKITDAAPTVQGLYILSDLGNYTNLGGLVATADKLNYAYFDGTTFSLVSAVMPKGEDGKTIERYDVNKNYVSGTVLFYNSKIYTAVENTNAGENPDNTPNKFIFEFDKSLPYYEDLQNIDLVGGTQFIRKSNNKIYRVLDGQILSAGENVETSRDVVELSETLENYTDFDVDNILDNKNLKWNNYGVSAFKRSDDTYIMYETDFIEGNKGDILIAEIAINGDALGIYDFNTKQFTRFMYFSNNTQKRKFMHVFSERCYFKVFAKSDFFVTPNFRISKSTLVLELAPEFVTPINNDVYKWDFSVKKGDLVKFRTLLYAYNIIEFKKGGTLFVSGLKNYTNEPLPYFFVADDDYDVSIFISASYKAGYVQVYRPITEEMYVTPFQKTGNNLEISKPQTLIKLDFTTTDAIPTVSNVFAKGEMIFKFENATFKKFCKINVQGSSSAVYPKKNWTITMYNDLAMTEKFSLSVNNSIFTNEWIYKANYIDASMMRNIAGYRLWKEMEKVRSGYIKRDIEKSYDYVGNNSFDTKATGVPDGFPCELYINGEWYGIGMFNLGKKKENYNLNDTLANHIQIETAYRQMDFTNLVLGEDYNFRSPKNITSVAQNSVIQFMQVANSSDAEFKTKAPLVFDIANLIDYYILCQLLFLPDNLGNNIMLTRWKDKFVFFPYDLDNAWGLNWDGTYLHPTNLDAVASKPDLPTGTINFWNKVKFNFKDEIKARYLELKKDAISLNNLYLIIKDIEVHFGQKKYQAEFLKWANPSVNFSSPFQILDWYNLRLQYLDSFFE